MTTKEKLLHSIGQSPEAQKPIWQVAQEIMSDVPDEVLNQLPNDGSAQHDHYIYGTPKR